MLKSLTIAAAFAVFCGLAVTPSAHAQSTSTATSVTATCKDGSTWTGTSKKGACSHHGGVASMQSSAAPAASAMAPAGSSTMSPSSTTSNMSTMSNNKSAAPGGGPGQVWVNSSSKVYHCPGDKYYGKTKNGQYMSESAAISAGDKPSHGKACSK